MAAVVVSPPGLLVLVDEVAPVEQV